MSFRKKIISLALLSLPCSTAIYASTWNGTGTNWSSAGSWNGAVPNAAGAIASFPATSSSNPTVSVDNNFTIGSLTFDTSSPSYMVSRPNLTNTITFDSSPSGATTFITVNSGSHTITSPESSNAFLSVAPTSPLSITTNPGSSLTIQAIIQGPTSTGVNIQGTVNFENISPNIGFGQIGSALLAPTCPVTISNGMVSCINNAITDQVPGAVEVQANNFTMNNSTLSMSNLAFVTNAGGPNSGCLLKINSTSNVNDSNVILYNAGPILGTGNQFTSGIIIQNFLSTLTFTGGNLTLLNTGDIQNTLITASGCFIVAHELILNDENISITNNGTISSIPSVLGSFGTGILGNYITLNGGTISLNNTGDVQDNCVGTRLGSNTILPSFRTITLTINSGKLTNSNSGQVGNNAFGSLVTALTVIQNGGLFSNDANLITDQFFIGQNATYAGAGMASNFTFGTTLQVQNEGTVVPGGPGPGDNVGTMTIDGNYIQTPTGMLVINFQDDSSFSKLMITGNANLAGTLGVAETSGGNVLPGATFTVLQANEGRTGTFAHLQDFTTPYLVPHVTYLPNSVEVFFTPTIFPDPSGIDDGINEKNAKGGYINLSRPIFSSVNETFTRLTREMGNLRSRFTKPVMEKMAFSVKKKTNSKIDFPIQLVTSQDDEPLSSFFDDETDSFLADIQEPETKEKSQRLTESLGTSQEKPWNFYVGPKGQLGNVISKNQMQGYRYWSAGAFTGFDYAFSNVGVGLLTEYERTDAHGGEKWGAFTIDAIHSDAYATYAPSQLPEIAFNAIVGGGYQWYSISRNVNRNIPLTLKGTPKGAEFDSLIGAEYSFRNSAFSAIPEGLQIIPEVALEYMYLHIDQYSEKGFQSFAFKTSQQNVKSLRSNLGFRLNYTWKTTNVEISPEANFAWQREFLDKDRSMDFTPIQFPNFGFPVEVTKMGRNTALAGVDILVTLYKKHGLELSYDFEYNSQYHTHFLGLSYNVRF
ncbi:MAG: autotransporter domain-containing protein [Chlamydiae bacterium]|nr:autotransporter domain-containing protein [Chlamydiota bacterium]